MARTRGEKQSETEQNGAEQKETQDALTSPIPMSSSAEIFLMKGNPESTAVLAIKAVLPVNASPVSRTYRNEGVK